MRGSLTIARIRGVPLRLHWTFVLVIGLIGWITLSTTGSLTRAGYAVGIILMVFVFVLIHELAHVAVAKRFGIPTTEITLLPIGGISHMAMIPQEPRREAAISAAGPLTNVFWALLFAYPVFHFHGGWAAFTDIQLIDPSRPNLLLDMFWLNVIMGAFNLLPAFPLDGGRVLRALIAVKQPYILATRIASSVGRYFGILMALGGVFVFDNIFLSIIGVFVYFGAAAEERQATAMAVFHRATAREAMQAGVETVHPDDLLTDVVTRSFHVRQLDFPVVDAGHLVGILDRTALSSGAGHEAMRVREAMTTDVSRIGPDDDLGVAFRAFQSGKSKALPVVDDGRRAKGLEPVHELRTEPVPVDHVEGFQDGHVAVLEEGEHGATRAPAVPIDGDDISFGRVRGLRFVGLLTIEDMERTFLFLTQRDGSARHTRVANPIGAGSYKRNYPRAFHTRRRQEPPSVHGPDTEEWSPIIGDPVERRE